MPEGLKPQRQWRAIAQEISAEQNTDTLAELCQELIEALDTNLTEKSGAASKPDDKRSLGKTA